MNLTNKFGLPAPIVRALTRDEYTRGDSNRSITQLIDSPRVRILRHENQNTMSEDVSEKVFSAVGTALHKLLEGYSDESHIAEERLFLDIDGWAVSGAIDIQRLNEDGTITVMDYKTTTAWAVMAKKPEWEWQLNCYGALVRRVKGVRVSGLSIIAFVRDWNRWDAQTRERYPPAPIIEIDIPMWTDEVQDAYLAARVAAHQDAEFKRLTGDELPLCSPAEQWAKPASFAVMKVGGKKAIKVFSSQKQADEYLSAGQEVVVRPGEMTRCVGGWCGISEHCSQYNNQK